jgi:hypothetical protein
MKNGASVTKEQLFSADLSVQRELRFAGFLREDSRLHRTDLYWCALPQVTMPDALGFFVHETSALHVLLGYKPGHIYIPKWVLLHGRWQRRGSLRDVIRHEYGHAIAHHYPSLIQRSRRFSTTFGGRYFGGHQMESSEQHFVSGYALTNSAEDFAETFMFFLRHKGELPSRLTSHAVKKKWRFIADLADVISSGGTRWR